MYEMEGASQSHSSRVPIARPAKSAERATIGRRTSENSGRLDARLP